MIERGLVLVGVIAIALALVAWQGRRRPAKLDVSAGITVFTGPGCTLCPGLLASLDRAGADYRTVDVSTEPVTGIRSLPTVVVVGEDGSTLLRRSGRAAITDLPLILAAAAGRTALEEPA